MLRRAFGGGSGARSAGDDQDLGRRERRIRAEFLPKLRRVLAQVPFAEDLLAAYYCVLDRRTPLAVRATLIGALAYFVLPFDLIPDVLAGIGFTDDAAVLFAALRSVAGAIEERHRDAARRWLSEAAAHPAQRDVDAAAAGR
jgi:uncharacterized membrane protein YkvA (DUF1232 family)